jgi:type VI secretion system protein ImpH
VSVIARLIADPRRFSFDAALRVLTAKRAALARGEMVRFRSAAGVAFAAAETVAVEAVPGTVPALTTTLIGLTGPSGTLPAHLTEMVVAAGRARSPSLGKFLDLLAQRFVWAFGEAGIKYRPQRDADRADEGRGGAVPVGDALLALTGQFLPGLPERLPTGPSPFRHYAGLFAARPRSVDRLEALASDFLERPVQVRQFAGTWLAISRDQQTRLPAGLAPGRYHRLGDDAAIGVRAWDQHARVVLRIGPLDGASFARMLPDRASLRRLTALVRAFLGFETGFAINLVLKRSEVPTLRLGEAGRLGWNSWLPGSAFSDRTEADEPMFEAEMIEGLEAGA